MNDQKVLHPALEQLADYGLGRLSEPDSAAVYAHLEACPECRRTVEALPDDTLASLVRAAATVPGLPPGAGGGHGAPPGGNTPLPDRSPPAEGTVAHSPDEATQAPDSAAAPAPRDDAARAAGPSAAAEGDTEHIPAPLLDHPRYRVLGLLGALSGSHDRTIRLWDVDRGKELYRFEGHTKEVVSIAVSPDGRHALSGSADSTMRLWNLPQPREAFSGALAPPAAKPAPVVIEP